jgi:hypothetical protein
VDSVAAVTVAAAADSAAVAADTAVVVADRSELVLPVGVSRQILLVLDTGGEG